MSKNVLSFSQKVLRKVLVTTSPMIHDWLIYSRCWHYVSYYLIYLFPFTYLCLYFYFAFGLMTFDEIRYLCIPMFLTLGDTDAGGLVQRCDLDAWNFHCVVFIFFYMGIIEIVNDLPITYRILYFQYNSFNLRQKTCTLNYIFIQ